LGLAEDVINTPIPVLLFGAVGLLGLEAVIVTAVPDDSAALVALQVVTGLVAVTGAGALAVTAFICSIAQDD
jgi:hypothetical protein